MHRRLTRSRSHFAARPSIVELYTDAEEPANRVIQLCLCPVWIVARGRIEWRRNVEKIIDTQERRPVSSEGLKIVPEVSVNVCGGRHRVIVDIHALHQGTIPLSRPDPANLEERLVRAFIQLELPGAAPLRHMVTIGSNIARAIDTGHANRRVLVV